MHSWVNGGVALYPILNNRAGKAIGRVFLAAVCAVGIGNA